jgi:hypothetical protein
MLTAPISLLKRGYVLVSHSFPVFSRDIQFTENGIPELLTTTFHLTVAPINAGDVNSMNALGMHTRNPVAGENGLSRRVNSDSVVPSFATLPQR